MNSLASKSRVWIAYGGLAAATAASGQAPQLWSITPNPANTGAVVTFKGDKLNLVNQVTFWNNRPAVFQHVNANTLTVTVPKGSITGKVKLTTSSTSVWSNSDFTVANGFVQPPNILPPAGALVGHPRLFMTVTDVPKLRGWAVNTNPIWVGLKTCAATAKADMDTHKVPDLDDGNGAGNYNPYPTEEYAELFAFMSQVDPNAANRADWAKRAHDLMMFMMNKAVLGQAQDTDPFRGKMFPIFNRSRWFGEAFPLTVDWAYQTFTPADKATIRKVFLRWVQENIIASVTSGEHPQPLGVVNQHSLTSSVSALRWASNNYYCNHARQVGMLAMALDDVDDVPAVPSDPKAGTLRKFVGNAIGAWLYQVKASEETATAGGISPEGIGYGESDTSGIAMLLLAMRTAGLDDAAVYGPGATLMESPHWKTEFLDAFMHSMSPKTVTQYNWVGPIHYPADFGDNGNYSVFNYIRTLGPIALAARSRGDTATYDKVRWMIDEYEPGRGATRSSQLSSALNNYGAMIPMMYFLVCDPNEAAKPDPRSGVATNFWGTGLNRMLSRTDWGVNASWFAYKCGWTGTDHNPQDGNKIEFYRKGEWLFKDRMGYGFNVNASDFKNTLAIENPSLTTNWFWQIEALRGSQFAYSPDGDPTVFHSFGNDYSYAQGNATNLYNSSRALAVDVKHASRSVLWLKPDVVVVYDRATTGAAGRFKRFYLNTQNLATVNGKLATATTPGGQKLFVQTLLPAGAVLTAQSLPPSAGGPDANETAQGEFMFNRIMVEDPAKPKNVRFLHVLQGADAGASPIATTLVNSDAGVTMQGAAFGSSVVLFTSSIAAMSTSTSFVIPAGTAKTYVTGLAVSAGYTVTTSAVAGGTRITITAGGPTISDAGGVLVI